MKMNLANLLGSCNQVDGLIHDLAVAVLPSEDQFATVWDLANNVWERYQSEQTRLDLCA